MRHPLVEELPLSPRQSDSMVLPQILILGKNGFPRKNRNHKQEFILKKPTACYLADGFLAVTVTLC